MKTSGFYKKQGGFVLLISMVIMLTVSSALAVSLINRERKASDRQKAIEAGVQLRAFSYGVMRYISEQGDSSVPGTYTGTAWLKTSSCSTPGTASSSYLPCSFPDKNRYRDDYTTVITVVGSDVEANISIPWPKVLGVQSAISAANLRTTAASDNAMIGEYGVTVTPAVLGFITFKDVVETQATKTIEATASNNSALGIWMRTDGSTVMNADMGLGGNSIVDVDDLIATGQITSGGLVISGTSFDSISTDGGVYAVGDILAEGEISAEGNISTLGRLDVGDGSSDSIINFYQSSVASENVTLRVEGAGDVVISNGDGDAQLIADRVYVQGVNRFASQAVYNMTIVPHGGRIDVITCPGSTVPQVFTSVSGLSQKTPSPISSFDVEISTYGSEWEFNVEMITATGRVSSGDISANILVAVKCS